MNRVADAQIVPPADQSSIWRAFVQVNAVDDRIGVGRSLALVCYRQLVKSFAIFLELDTRPIAMLHYRRVRECQNMRTKTDINH